MHCNIRLNKGHNSFPRITVNLQKCLSLQDVTSTVFSSLPEKLFMYLHFTECSFNKNGLPLAMPCVLWCAFLCTCLCEIGWTGTFRHSSYTLKQDDWRCSKVTERDIIGPISSGFQIQYVHHHKRNVSD